MFGDFSRDLKSLFELSKFRITEIRIIVWRLFKGPESLVRISKSTNYTSSNYTSST